MYKLFGVTQGIFIPVEDEKQALAIQQQNLSNNVLVWVVYTKF